MFIRFFKPNQSLGLFIIPVIVILLWIPAYINPIVWEADGTAPLYTLIVSFFKTLVPGVYVTFCAIIVILQSLYLNYIFNRHEILTKKTNLGLIVYPLFMSGLSVFLKIHPIIFVNIFLLVAFDKLFSLYKNNSALPLIFDICTILSIGSLFYLPAAYFLLLVWISLIILRPFVWREWTVAILGFALPYFMLALVLYLRDGLTEWINHLFVPSVNLSITNTSGFQLYDKLVLCFFLALMLLAIVKIQATFYKNVIRTRGYQQVLLFSIVICMLSIFMKKGSEPYDLLILSVPATFLISYYFLSVKRTWIAELLFTTLITLIIIEHISSTVH